MVVCAVRFTTFFMMSDVLNFVDYIINFVRIALDFVVIFIFLSMVKNFIQRKKERIKNESLSNEGKLTKFNKFIVFWVFLMSFNKLIHTLLILLTNRYVRLNTFIGKI